MGLVHPPAHFRPTPRFRTPRRRILARIRLVNSCGEEIDAIVRDISCQGMAAAARGAPPALDEVVSVLLPSGGQVWGMVRWVDRNLFGVEFEASPETAEATALLD